jgi:hypothetical protein
MSDKPIDAVSSAQIKQRFRLPPTAADMAVCFAITFAAYALYNDDAAYVLGIADPLLVNRIFKLISCAALVLIWIILSFQNGRRGRNGFLAFIITFWTVPLAVGLVISAGDIASATGAASRTINIVLFFIKIITQSPSAGIDLITQYLPITNAFAVCFLTAVFSVTYLFAYLTGTLNHKKTPSDNIERGSQNET